MAEVHETDDSTAGDDGAGRLLAVHDDPEEVSTRGTCPTEVGPGRVSPTAIHDVEAQHEIPSSCPLAADAGIGRLSKVWELPPNPGQVVAEPDVVGKNPATSPATPTRRELCKMTHVENLPVGLLGMFSLFSPHHQESLGVWPQPCR